MSEDDGRHHAVIWLQPWCDECEHARGCEGRQWCQDNVWEPCEECGNLTVKYTIECMLLAAAKRANTVLCKLQPHVHMDVAEELQAAIAKAEEHKP